MEGVLGSVTLFAGSFEPKNWLFCQGQILAIRQNTALFSIIGTLYGGDGKVTFALPDLRGRTVVGAGQGPGLTYYDIGEQDGQEVQTMNNDTMPLHTHSLTVTIRPAAAATATTTSPKEAVYATSSEQLYSPSADSPGVEYPANLVSGPAGAAFPFSTLHPVLGLNYIICIAGIFPVRG